MVRRLPSCPDEATVDRLKAGLLPEPQAGEIRRHLDLCPYCVVSRLPVTAGRDPAPPTLPAPAEPSADGPPPAAAAILRPVPAGPLTGCPNCGGSLAGATGSEWCIKCGFYAPAADAPPPEQSAEPETDFQIPSWSVLLLIGAFAIIGVSVMRRSLLPADAITWWIVYELGLGLLAYAVGHGTAAALTIKDWRNPKMSDFFDPLNVWLHAAKNLGRTWFTLFLGVWGATAFLTGLVLFMRNDFTFKEGLRPVEKAVDGTTGGR